MTVPSPTCTVNGSAPPQSVTAGATVTVALANPTGANFWGLVVLNCDDSSTLATIQASLVVNQVAKTATFTAPSGLGSAVILQSTVGVSPSSSQGSGRDVNGNVQAAYTTTFKVNVLTSGGLAVLVPNETVEQSQTSGNTVEINAAIRASGANTFQWLGQQTVNSGSSPVTASNGSLVWADCSSGGVTVDPPGTLTAGNYFGIVDGHKGGSFNASHYVSIPNASGLLEDPNNPNTYSTSTITMKNPGMKVIWQADPTGSFWKVISA